MKTNKLDYLVLFVLFAAIVSCGTETEEPRPTYTLSTAASPTEGGTIAASSSGPYTEGQTVTLTPQANTDWVFQEWEGDASGSSAPLTLTMSSNKSVTGVFVKRDYPLTITIEGEGTVNETIVTNPSGREYPHGTTVELTPVPGEGWVFDSWGGDLSGNEIPQRITVDGQKNVIVRFKIREYPLNITVEGEGTVNEVVVTSPGSREYPNGTIVELTPVPNEGWVFESWGGDLSGNEVPQRITVDGERNVTVIFKPESSGVFYLADNGITCKCEGVEPGDKGFIDGIEYEAVDNGLLRQRKGVDMTRLCTSLVTDMSEVLSGSYEFNQPIGNWDVSNVTNMQSMFAGSTFNQPIGDWDVSNVTTMEEMFLSSSFNQPIGDWDVSNVTNMQSMFGWNSVFNQPIGNWNVSNVTNMSGMFGSNFLRTPTSFNQPIGDWDVSKVTNMQSMFAYSQFNQPIGDWDVSNVTNMQLMFYESKFDQPIGDWNVSNVTNMQSMFANLLRTTHTSFNQPIGDWDVSNVTNMQSMFSYSQFNQPIGDWDVSKVTNMQSMFSYSQFDQSIGKWDVSKVTNMFAMFAYSLFNQPIGDWDVSNVINFVSMFKDNKDFNQDLSKWCVSKISRFVPPQEFAYEATAWVLPKPIWGTCPD